MPFVRSTTDQCDKRHRFERLEMSSRKQVVRVLDQLSRVTNLEAANCAGFRFKKAGTSKTCVSVACHVYVKNNVSLTTLPSFSLLSFDIVKKSKRSMPPNGVEPVTSALLVPRSTN